MSAETARATLTEKLAEPLPVGGIEVADDRVYLDELTEVRG